MAPSHNVELQALQAAVQQRLGQCVLQLQAYERLIKAIVAECEVSGTSQGLDRDARAAEVGRKTLGGLVSQLLGSFLTAELPASIPDPEPKASDGRVSFRIKVKSAIPAADFVRIESDLKDFVCLRNELIHHFLERHDLSNREGCMLAEDALTAAHSRFERHYEDLRQWAEDLVQLRHLTAEVMGSDVVRGLLVNCKLPWPRTEIVGALREAAAELAVDGWAPVSEASALISLRYPDQLPSNYGCRSWRQVLHESGVFDLRYRETGDRRATWYREKMPA